MITFRWKKSRDILDAQKLLSILPQSARLPTVIRNIILLAYLVVSMSLILIGFEYSQSMGIAMVLLVALLSILFVPIILISNKSYPLVFTNKGIVLYPYIAEYWSDIAGYGWQTYADISGFSLKSHQEKKVLFIANKGGLLRQRNLVRWHLSLMGHHHLYPNEQQLLDAEKIFSCYGIKKFEDPLDAIDSQ